MCRGGAAAVREPSPSLPLRQLRSLLRALPPPPLVYGGSPYGGEGVKGGAAEDFCGGRCAVLCFITQRAPAARCMHAVCASLHRAVVYVAWLRRSLPLP